MLLFYLSLPILYFQGKGELALALAGGVLVMGFACYGVYIYVKQMYEELSILNQRYKNILPNIIIETVGMQIVFLTTVAFPIFVLFSPFCIILNNTGIFWIAGLLTIIADVLFIVVTTLEHLNKRI